MTKFLDFSREKIWRCFHIFFMEGFWVAFLQFSRSAILDPFHFFGARFIKVFGKTLKFLRVFLTKFWVCSRKNFGGCFLGGLLHFCWQNSDICSTIFGGVLEVFRLVGNVWKLVRPGRRPQRRHFRGRSPLGKDRPVLRFTKWAALRLAAITPASLYHRLLAPVIERAR